MRVLYWARLALARAAIIDAVQAVPGCQLTVADTLDDALAGVAHADALVLYDAPVADARLLCAAVFTVRGVDGAGSRRAARRGGAACSAQFFRWSARVSATSRASP